MTPSEMIETHVPVAVAILREAQSDPNDAVDLANTYIEEANDDEVTALFYSFVAVAHSLVDMFQVLGVQSETVLNALMRALREED